MLNGVVGEHNLQRTLEYIAKEITAEGSFFDYQPVIDIRIQVGTMEQKFTRQSIKLYKTFNTLIEN